MKAAVACVICGKAHSAVESCDEAAADTAPSGIGPRVDPSLGEDAMIGKSLGNFRIVRMLGKGGMGTVYLGEHAIIGSKVAIKFLHPHLVGEKALIERFFAEATAVNLIGHENIVSIFDLSKMPPNRWYLVMEYLDGVPLSTLAGAPMPLEVAVPILAQACDALQAAHGAKVIHRDLKPENIFLVRRGGYAHFVKLVDFGIAKLGAQAAGGGVTVAGLVVGTPEYMAPEQWLGEAIDGRADLYALGVTAYLLATGQLPFREASPLAYYSAHQEKRPRPPRELVPTLPEAYEAVLLKALAKKREDRFQSALEMREALCSATSMQFSRPGTTPFPGRLPTPLTPLAPPQITPSKMPDVGGEPRPTTPPPVSPPLPRQQLTPASLPALQASVSGPGYPERTLPTADLTKAGLFVQAAAPLPDLFSRVTIALLHPQRRVELLADVVRHVDAAQARAWSLPGEGFAVQFAQLSPAQRDVLTRVIEGRALEAERAHPDDPKAAVTIAAWENRLGADHYAVLMLTPESERSDVRGRLRRAQQEVVKLLACPLSEKQKKATRAIDARLRAISAAFESPVSRAEYDASLANWRGVTRCMGEGLSTADMALLRKRFLGSRPKNEADAHLRAVSAAALAKGGNEHQALQEYEAALALDPLHDELHRAYWALRRRLAKSGAGTGRG